MIVFVIEKIIRFQFDESTVHRFHTKAEPDHNQPERVGRKKFETGTNQELTIDPLRNPPSIAPWSFIFNKEDTPRSGAIMLADELAY